MMDNSKISWPGWETVKLIGRGSFGAVYEIQRSIPGSVEKAALKVISIPQNDSDFEEMYINGYDEESLTITFQSHRDSIIAEYNLMRKMYGSANVVNCDDFRCVQHDDGIGWDIFIKMELLTPLAKTLPAQIPEEMAVKIAKDMCAALELCQKYNIVHRDIKPQNIFLSPNGDYKLGDFGIAKTVEKTMGGTIIGTYNYMAPEVYNNQDYKTTPDIYSLGLVIYWLLNERRLPFLPLPPEKIDANMEKTARERRFKGETLPPPAHGNEGLKKIVLKACAYDPKDRYATAAEMLRDLNGGFTDAELLRGQEEERIRKEEEERFRKEAEAARKKAEEDRKRKEEAERLAREQAAREARVRAEREREEKERREKERLEWERQQKEKENGSSKSKGGIIIGAACLLILLIIGIMIAAGSSSNAGNNQPNGVSGNANSSSNGGSNTQHTHEWSPATCTAPKTCRTCGKTEGSALAHQWTSATCTNPSMCAVCGAIDGTANGHAWIAANCTTPKTCQTCGATEGVAEGHTWVEATCSNPKTCERCGATEGDVRAHQWITATFTSPSTCSLCGATRGSSINHPLTYCQVIEHTNEEGSTTDVAAGSWEDTFGNVRTNSLKLWVMKTSGCINTEHIIYQLGGAYEILAGSVVASNSSKDGSATQILIYADGQKIFDSGLIYRDTAPVDFVLNVNGVNQLKVECVTESPKSGHCILDAKLSKP